MTQPKLDIQAALEEVRNKTAAEIEEETAYKWAARAIACYRYYAQTLATSWLIKADNFEHEAIEHAAFVRDNGVTLGIIENVLDSERAARHL